MSRARIERNAPADPALAIHRATTCFTTMGYETEPATYGSAQLVYAKGSRNSLRLDEHRHTLRILHEGSKLVFEFSTGLGSSGMVIASELQALEERVDRAMRAGPDGSSKVGCRFCGRITDSAAPSCEGCGSADFV
ncbi:MAG: hypothetical protein H6Q89_1959 [Myxococcaceae bacterium]|nr:hypothetical protein [Myxococcaceae bacterium]